MSFIHLLKKSDLLLPLTVWATAAFMVGLISGGFLLIQTSASLPDAQSIRDVELKIPLRIYSSEGLLISEFGNERRKPVVLEQVPPLLVDAILASEDDNFYHHHGIDFTGLIRAAISNFRSGQSQQGASTITMQVARNFFLSREKTYSRKLREVLLAFRLEQLFSKDEILALYINKIFLGHRSYGFGAAADVYYGRELAELSLAELAMLAGLPQAPSSNNPLRSPERATKRRNYVLDRLKTLNKIDDSQYQTALAAPVTAEKHGKGTELDAPHIAEMVRAKLVERLGEEAYWQGLSVHTTISAKQQQAAERALRKGLQSYDRRHGFRGPIAKIDRTKVDLLLSSANEDTSETFTQVLQRFPSSHEQIPALIIELQRDFAVAQSSDHGSIKILLETSLWARRHLTVNRLGEQPSAMTDILQVGDVVYLQPIESDKQISEDELSPSNSWRLSQIPNIGGALISMQPNTGEVLALVGGYDFFLNKYNRAMQSIRQPGSNIKPFIYSAALDQGFTPATLVSGAPIVITDATHGTVWRPENYSGKFFGPTRIREALTKSLNLVSIRLLRAIGVPFAREYLSRFGIDMSRFSPTLTMALGSGGVTPMEMLSAYSVLANTGYKVEPYFIERITDRQGEVIFQAPQAVFCDECYDHFLAEKELAEQPEVDLDETATEEILDEAMLIEVEQQQDTPQPPELTYQAQRVMSKTNNFLTVSMLKDVIRHGTARKALALSRPDLAGKTGTTNDYVDAWFSGFNSQLAATVWIGFDEPSSMGRGEAGSVAALPIWIDFMRTALQGLPLDSDLPPDFIEQGLVNRNSGKRSNELDPDAVIEYFSKEPALLQASEITDAALGEEDSFELLEGTEMLEELAEPEPLQRILGEDEDTEGLF